MKPKAYIYNPYNRNVLHLSLKRQEKQMQRLAEFAWGLIASAAIIAIVAIGGSLTFPY